MGWVSCSIRFGDLAEGRLKVSEGLALISGHFESVENITSIDFDRIFNKSFKVDVSMDEGVDCLLQTFWENTFRQLKLHLKPIKLKHYETQQCLFCFAHPSSAQI